MAPRGRKRDDSRTDAILMAALELLKEVGFDAVKIEAVAERAGVGLATIYRRWDSKSALLADVIRLATPGHDTPLTGDAEADLRRIIHGKTELLRNHPHLLPGLIAAIRSDPVIADAVLDEWRTTPFRKVISNIVPNHPQLDLLTEIVPALLVYRGLLIGELYDPDLLADHLIGLIKGG